MNFGQPIGAPQPTVDEMRIRQLDAAIAAAEKWQREKAAREAEEARLEAERKAATGGYDVEQLKAARAALVAQEIERETHLRAEAEWQVIARRRERLRVEIDASREHTAALEAEDAMLAAKLG